MTDTPPTSPPSSTQALPESLSARLAHAAEQVKTQHIDIGTLFNEIGRGSPYLLIALLSIPFSSPIPLPGLSIPFGAAIITLAVGAIIGRRTHQIPSSIAKRPVSPKVAGLLKASAQLSGVLERLMKPRWAWAVWPHSLALGAIALCGFCLLLPIPLILFNNMPAALSALLISLGMLYRDGLAMIVASLAFALMIIFYGVIAWGALQLLGRVIP